MKPIEVYIKSTNVLFELLSEKYEFNGTPLQASGEKLVTNSKMYVCRKIYKTKIVDYSTNLIL